MAALRTASVVSAGGRRHTVDESKLHVTSVLAQKGEHAVLDHIADADEEILGALGYKQEFKRYARRFPSPSPRDDKPAMVSGRSCRVKSRDQYGK